MLVIKRVVEPRNFTPSSQADSANPLVVRVMDLTPKREAEIRDSTINMTFKDVEGGKTSPLINISSKSVDYQIVVHSICGWDNVQIEDEKGDVRDFRFSRNIADIDAFLTGLTRADREELFRFVLGDDDKSDTSDN